MTIGVNGNMRWNDCVDTNNRNKYTTSFTKHAQDAGKATGFVTNTRITHATVNLIKFILKNIFKWVGKVDLNLNPTIFKLNP